MTLKQLIKEGIVSPAILPKTNDWIYTSEGKTYIAKLAKENDKEKIAQFHRTITNHLDFIDFTELDSTKFLTLFSIDHDYDGKSALMQNSVFQRFNLPVKALFFVADPKNYLQIYEALKQDTKYIGGGAGAGFKHRVLDVMDSLDESAKFLQSINMIVRNKQGNVIGCNTDGLGFREGIEKLLQKKNLLLKGKKIVFLGAGGVASPLVYEMVKLNPLSIIIANRTVQKAIDLADKINKHYQIKICRAIEEDGIKEELKDAYLVVNISNKGANGRYTAFAPVDSISEEEHYKQAEENISSLPKEAIVSDILLMKEKTPTLRLAEKHGHITQDGDLMVLYQGVPALSTILKENQDRLVQIPSEKEIYQVMYSALFN